MRLLSASMLRITHVDRVALLDDFRRVLHALGPDMSEMWIRPSMPGSISTKAPKEVRLRTLPLMRVPTGYLSGSTIHGSCSVCFMPSEIFSSLGRP